MLRLMNRKQKYSRSIAFICIENETMIDTETNKPLKKKLTPI